MKRKDTKKPSRTDWRGVKAMSDSEIDCSEVPEIGVAFFARAVFWPGPKKQITLRLDPDVLEFFKHQGRGYQRNINTVLRRYVDLQRQRHAG